MGTQCHSEPLEFEGHCSRRRLVAKKLIPSLIFFVLRAPSWIEDRRFLPLVRNAG